MFQHQLLEDLKIRETVHNLKQILIDLFGAGGQQLRELSIGEPGQFLG